MTISLNIFIPYVVAADQHLFYTDPNTAQGVILLNGQAINPVSSVGQWSPNPDATLTILGSVGMVFSSNAYVVGIEEVNTASNGPFFVAIGQGGSFSLASEGSAEGYWGEAPFANNGSFYVSSAQTATGVQYGDFSGRVNDLSGFDNTGSFTVRGHGAAGVENVRGHFFNSGTMTVDGEGSLSTAAMIVYGAAVTNSGVITASSTGLSIGFPTGFSIPPNMPDNRAYPSMTVTNTGTITAPTAISLPGATLVSLARLENSGTINGDIWAAGTSTVAGSADHGAIIHNTGAIHGKITLDGFGNDIYDGRGGTLSGGIVFTAGANGYDTFYLGDDGESVRGVSPNALGDPIGAANLTVYGGAGADTITGGLGVTYIDGGAGNDVLTGGGRVSTVAFASATSGVTVSLALSTAQDTGDGLKTLASFQNLTGSAFNDHLTGDAKANIIDGGGGSDVLTGGGGADTFVFRPEYGANEITDFSHAQGDKIDLSVFANLSAFSTVLADAALVGSNTVISLPGGGTITLDNLQPSSLQASDFILQTVPSTIDNAFGGGTTSAVAFVNTATGDLGYMTANASGGETWHPVGPTSTAYAVVAKGDFNGDGVLDIAFRSTVTGGWGFMSVNPTGGETWHDAGATSLAYEALGSGDFSGNGRVGIAFRNAATGAWGYMTANTSGGETWHDVGATSTAYKVVGIGDFDGSGIDSIAFRNDATGDFGYMSANAAGGEAWHPIGATGTSYAAIGFGDFNGDGVLDVAFRNSAIGDWGFMSVNPGGGETWHGVGATSLAYASIGAADYNGDGLTDLAFRNAAGDWGYMSYTPSTGGEAWHSVGSTSTAYMAI